METINFDLYFDPQSQRARVTWGREDRVLRDIFPNREAAEAAALAMVRKALSSNIGTRVCPEICVWAR